jgi:hypothetical protein
MAGGFPGLSPPPSLRVVMPGVPTPTVTMVPFREGMRVQDVIDFVARRHRLAVFYERYVLKVGPNDQARLNMPTRELPPQALVAPLGLDSVELTKKTYADSPPERAISGQRSRGSLAVAEAGGGGSIGGGYYGRTGREDGGRAGHRAVSGSRLRPGAGAPGGGAAAAGGGAYDRDAGSAYGRANAAGGIGSAVGGGQGMGPGAGGGGQGYPDTGSLAGAAAGSMAAGGGGALGAGASGAPALGLGPGGIMHNAITAAQFQEWPVVKVNKRGRRQERLMGIDLARITNRKVEKTRLLASEKTVNAERLISDIRRVEIPEQSSKTAFAITFKEIGVGGSGAAGGGGGGGGAGGAAGAGGADAGGGGGDGGGEDVTLTYEARTPGEREEIVSKLVYIMRMNGDLHKVARVP